jgi:hypothetical protein
MVFYTEEYENYSLARQQEIFFKTTAGWRKLKSKLTHFAVIRP